MVKTDTCTEPEPNLDRPLGKWPFRSGQTGKRLRRKTNGWKKQLRQLNRWRIGYLREYASLSHHMREQRCRQNEWWGVFQIASSWIVGVPLIVALSFLFRCGERNSSKVESLSERSTMPETWEEDEVEQVPILLKKYPLLVLRVRRSWMNWSRTSPDGLWGAPCQTLESPKRVDPKGVLIRERQSVVQDYEAGSGEVDGRGMGGGLRLHTKERWGMD